MTDKIYDCFKKNSNEDIITSLVKAESALVNLPLTPDQRERIDMSQVINLIRECGYRFSKLKNYRKKYKRFKRKYIDLRALIRINDTVSRKEVLNAIDRWSADYEITNNITVEVLCDIIKGLPKSPKIIKEEKNEN